MPLLVAEAERVGVERRAAGVSHKNVDRAEEVLDLVDEHWDPFKVAAVVSEAGRADLFGGLLDVLLIA